MKRIFLLYTASFMMISSFSQIEIPDKAIIKSEKWAINPVKGLKTGTGRLNLNFPEGTSWSIDIYKGNKFLVNKSIETWKIKYYDLPVGVYNMKLNTVMIENVSIEEGKETRLSTGSLKINSSDWELLSEDKKKFHTSGNKPRVMILPAGKYVLVNGKTPEEVLVTAALNPAINPAVLETEQWIARPINSNMKIEKQSATGRLNLDMGDKVTKGIYGLHIYNPTTKYQKSIFYTDTIRHLRLAPGLYRITWSGTNIKYENVKILEDHETSLKHVTFVIQADSKWFIGVGPPSSNGCGPRKIALPVGIGISLWPVGSYVEGFVQTFTNLNSDGIVEYAKIGYLQCSQYFTVQDGCMSSYNSSTVALIPGKYSVKVNGVVKQVTVKAGETVVLE